MCALSVISVLLVACGSAPEPTSTANSPAAQSPGAALEPGSQEALNQAIASMDAVIYAYGIIGARTRGADQRQALRAINALGRQRVGLESALGTHVNEAGVAYVLPEPLNTAEQAAALAGTLELQLIALFDQVASTSTGLTKALASQASLKAAQRAKYWAASTTMPQ